MKSPRQSSNRRDRATRSGTAERRSRWWPGPDQKYGQVMVLSCITMLMLAFMTMLSFTLTQTVHEKIRLQSHSDSMAYSMATVEARAQSREEG